MAVKLDCKNCNGKQSMYKAEIDRFSPVVVIIGWIIVTPSLLGIFVSTIMLFSGMNGDSFTGIRVTISLAFGVFSLLSGLLGYILIMKKKVYKCNICGSTIDRA